MSKRGDAVAVAAVLLLLAAGCGGGNVANTGIGTAGSPPQLKSIRQLQTVFNKASREPTLVVLIAPT